MSTIIIRRSPTYSIEVKARGVQGAPGTTGNAGTPGTPGQDGQSAYEIAVDDGFSGDETAWLASLVGQNGEDGWTPVFAVVADGSRYVQQVVDWTGGTGSKPATGKYVGASGFEDLIANGVDIRGASGSGSGDVSGPASATDGVMALFDGSTGKLLKAGTAPFSGDYGDLSNKPSIPAAQVNSDWAASTGISEILNKPSLATVATSGQYSDLAGTPTLANVATSGSYNDLSGAPSLATVATSGSYSDLSSTPTLGGAAALNVGTGNGTVAAGDDSRITGALQAATENQTIEGGAAVTSKDLGTQSSGTLTLDMGDRPLQHYTNNGAHTLAPGSVKGACMVDITNGGSAGAITTSGFTKVAGDSFTTTNGHKFRCHVSVGEAGSLLIVQALQ